MRRGTKRLRENSRGVSSTLRFLISVGLVGPAILAPAPSASADVVLPPRFENDVVFSGLNLPVAMDFAPNGTEAFVAEKAGRILVFDDIADTTPHQFADLSANVYGTFDRGLLGLAIDPEFPSEPYVYVLYTFDGPIGGPAGRWNDLCPTPPGPGTEGCPASGRLSRLTAVRDSEGAWTAMPEEMLLQGWCQQFQAHSIGDLHFGPSGALYASAGEGAAWSFADYGQAGGGPGSPVPKNPCGDPPGGVGGTMTAPTSRGGSLRAQSPRRPNGEPVVLNGSILRIDPETGDALPDNPWADRTDVNARRIVGFGLRNPFRFAVRPGSEELWVGDVGAGVTEEINLIPDPITGPVRNFGWPCYEGPTKRGTFNSMTMCTGLYADTTDPMTPAMWSYQHTSKVVPGESCPIGSSAITGLVFYEGGSYPPAYDGALFIADQPRACIWAMLAGADGLPDPSRIVTLLSDPASLPVDLDIGPGGDLFYVNIGGGSVQRIRYRGSGPIVSATADPTFGPLPLTVVFDGTASTDPDPGETLEYAWDLDGDSEFDDASGATATWTYEEAVDVGARLRVTDSSGNSDVSEPIALSPGNTPPRPAITLPAGDPGWAVGDLIDFAGGAEDDEEGAIPAAQLSWRLIQQHCPSNCHIHDAQAWNGVAEGSFAASDHEFPSYLQLQLTATDARGLSVTTSVDLHPRTATLLVETLPPGLQVAVNGEQRISPVERSVIVGSANSVTAPSPQTLGGLEHRYASWTDGGSQTHIVTVPEAGQSLIAIFEAAPPTILFGAHCGARPAQPTTVDACMYLESQIGRQLGYVRSQHRWDAAIPSPLDRWATGPEREGILHLSVRARKLDGTRIPWAEIAAGLHDARIDEIGGAIKSLGRPVYFTFHHEPEQDLNLNGTKADFIAAWKHVRARFAAGDVPVEHAWLLVAETFNQSAGATALSWYPGDDQVDLISADGYAWLNCRDRNELYPSFRSRFQNFYNWGTAHGKPLIVAEWGAVEDPLIPGRKAAWIAQAQADLKTHMPNIKAVSYFHFGDYSSGKHCDWWIDSTPGSLQAWTDMAADPYYQGYVNRVPSASASTDRTFGPLPLTVAFDGAASTDPDPGDTLEYAWDLDGDGEFDDATGPTASWTYEEAVDVAARLRIIDPSGASDVSDPIALSPGNTPPRAVITLPATDSVWTVGDSIDFAGGAEDEEETIAATQFEWELIQHHCPGSCHVHDAESWNGIAEGSFVAPDHHLPSHLELRLTATDARGLSSTASIDLHPRTTTLLVETLPPGLQVEVNGETAVTPVERTVIVGSTNSVGAPSPQTMGALEHRFASWSDEGSQTHTVTVPEEGKSLTATFDAAPLLQTVPFSDDFESGDLSKWTDSSAVSVQGSEVSGGAWAARATGTGSPAWVSKSLAAEPELYAKTRVKILSQGANGVTLLGLRTPDGAALASVNANASGKLTLYNGVVPKTITSATVISKGAWHDLELRAAIAGAASQVEVWLDGVRVSALSPTLQLGTVPIGQVRLGEPTAGRTFDLAFDDFAASRTRPTPPPVFTDGFETGNLSKWTTSVSMAVQGSEISAGAWAGRATGAGTASWVSKTMPSAVPELYAGGRVKIVTQGATPVTLFGLRTASGASLLTVNASATGKLTIYNGFAPKTSTGTTTISKGAWHDLEVHARIAGTSSQVEVWLDGAPVTSLTKTLSLGTAPIGQLRLGEPNTGRTFDVVFDDVSASITRSE